jgi:uncharacterized protein DUF6941
VIKCVTLLCSDDYSVDRETGNISLFSILDRIHCSAFPAVINRFAICFYLTRDSADPEDFQVTVIIEHNGTNLFTQGIEVPSHGELRCSTTIKVHGFPMGSPGSVKVKVQHKDEPLAEWTIGVTAEEPKLFVEHP